MPTIRPRTNFLQRRGSSTPSSTGSNPARASRDRLQGQRDDHNRLDQPRASRDPLSGRRVETTSAIRSPPSLAGEDRDGSSVRLDGHFLGLGARLLRNVDLDCAVGRRRRNFALVGAAGQHNLTVEGTDKALGLVEALVLLFVFLFLFALDGQDAVFERNVNV